MRDVGGERVELAHLVDELRVAHPGREIVIDATGDLTGRWDRGRIGQVISNLVGNALTHGSRESPIRLTLSRDDGATMLAVSNRGKTIPPTFRERLFEPFWQAPKPGAAKSRGLGLGLFIARQIVEAHHGAITVESVNEQTTFTVRLPR